MLNQQMKQEIEPPASGKTTATTTNGAGAMHSHPKPANNGPVRVTSGDAVSSAEIEYAMARPS